MKKQFWIISILAVTFAVGCNKVNFTQKPADACNVSAPCLKGDGLAHVAQDLTFTRTNKVDILIVDDNSGSMGTEQANLGTAFNGFANNLNSSGMDWQLAVTNTDVCPIAGGLCNTPNGVQGARGRFIGPKTSSVQPSFGSYILNNSTPNVTNLFNSIIQRQDEVGSGDERGIYAANLAIDLKDSSNVGFFRDYSNLALIFLTDEDERSVGGQLPNDPGYVPLEDYDQPQTLLNKVTTTWNGQKSVVANSIIIKTGDTGCLAAQQAQAPYYSGHYGTVYEQMSALAGNGSVVGSICDNGAGSFAQMLSQISGVIHDLPLLNSMTLNYTPLSKPVVSFSPAANAVGWTWNAGTNMITFAVRPAVNTVVHAEYDFKTN